jgi:ribonucleoside-diphosphate reductase beta chain
MELPGILTPSVGYKPFRYPQFYDKWQTQQRIHWLPEEVPLAEDVKDWAINLTDEERSLLTHIFRFFTQSDIEVQDNYMTRLGQLSWPTEVKMMLASFANMETVHIAAYSNLIETVGMPETTYSQFLEYDELKAKHETYQRFDVSTSEGIAKTLAMFGGFVEGVQLFASFAVLMNFPRRNRMKGMGQIVSWSVRDESLHCDGITDLFKTYAAESGCLTRGLKGEIYDIAELVVNQEDRFVDLAFDRGSVEGISVDEMKHYIRFMTDYRLRNLGLKSIFKSGRKHPLPWLTPLLSGHEHANFFETRATEYSKAATRGSWSDVWADLDKTGYEFTTQDDPTVTAAFASEPEQNSWGHVDVR